MLQSESNLAQVPDRQRRSAVEVWLLQTRHPFLVKRHKHEADIQLKQYKSRQQFFYCGGESAQAERKFRKIIIMGQTLP